MYISGQIDPRLGLSVETALPDNFIMHTCRFVHDLILYVHMYVRIYVHTVYGYEYGYVHTCTIHVSVHVMFLSLLFQTPTALEHRAQVCVNLMT